MLANEESTALTKKITLKTSEGELFEVEEAVAMESETIKSFFEDDFVSDDIVPLPNVSSDDLVKVVQYCEKHIEFRSKSAPKDEIKAFDDDFINQDNATIISLIHAANYLNIKDLLELLCQHIADKIKEMTVEQVRDFFGIENDYTPEEERQLREENKWAFE